MPNTNLKIMIAYRILMHIIKKGISFQDDITLKRKYEMILWCRQKCIKCSHRNNKAEILQIINDYRKNQVMAAIPMDRCSLHQDILGCIFSFIDFNDQRLENQMKELDRCQKIQIASEQPDSSYHNIQRKPSIANIYAWFMENEYPPAFLTRLKQINNSYLMQSLFNAEWHRISTLSEPLNMTFEDQMKVEAWTKMLHVHSDDTWNLLELFYALYTDENNNSNLFKSMVFSDAL